MNISAYTPSQMRQALGIDIEDDFLSQLTVQNSGRNKIFDISNDLAIGFQMPDEIPSGGRNQTLLQYAGHLRGIGVPQDEIDQRLLEANRTKCTPPLDPAEVIDVSRRYDGEPNEEVHSRDASAVADVLNSQIFAELNRDKLINVYETGEWLSFDNKIGWVNSIPHAEMIAAKQVCQNLRENAAGLFLNNPESAKTKKAMSHAEQSAKKPRIDAMIELAKSEPGLTATMSEFDSDPWRLGLPEGGELDMRSCTVIPPNPSSRCTKRIGCKYDPAAKCPNWNKLIKWITNGDKAYARYLQRSLGYLLTGDVSEQMFWFIYGHGMNGKSTVAEIWRALLGDYAVILPITALMNSRTQGNAPDPNVMQLKGARLALTSETEESSKLAEAQLKLLTGGDSITARPLYASPVTWQPTHKILMVGNHKPIITGTDLGIWRRLHLVPFENTISPSKADPDLPIKLHGELPGILNWALSGLADWRKNGLNPPAVISDSVDEYRTDMDIVGQWLDEQTDAAPGEWTPTQQMYRSYQAWAQEAGLRPMTKQSFGRRLKDRGLRVEQHGPSRTRHVEGIRLRPAVYGSRGFDSGV